MYKFKQLLYYSRISKELVRNDTLKARPMGSVMKLSVKTWALVRVARWGQVERKGIRMKSLLLVLSVLGVASVQKADAAKVSCAGYAANYTKACEEDGYVLESGNTGCASFSGTNCYSTTLSPPDCGCEATCSEHGAVGSHGISQAGNTINSPSKVKPKLKFIGKKLDRRF